MLNMIGANAINTFILTGASVCCLIRSGIQTHSDSFDEYVQVLLASSWLLPPRLGFSGRLKTKDRSKLESLKPQHLSYKVLNTDGCVHHQIASDITGNRTSNIESALKSPR